MLNLDQILSAARWFVTTLGTYYATKGVVTEDQVQLIGGAVAAIISLAWSFYTHAGASKTPTGSSSS